MDFKSKADKTIEYFKKNGFKKTADKIKYKIFNFIKNRKEYIENENNYRLWIENNEPNESQLEEQRKKIFEYAPKISIVVPMYNTKEIFLKELVLSVMEQTYQNWELCLADGSPKKLEYIDNYVSQSEKIKYKYLNENMGISGNTNCAIEMSTGDYIALLDHDDILPKFSLYEIVKAINKDKDAEFIYTDEDKIFEGKRNGPHFKSDFAPDTLMSYNYICHFSILKRNLMERIGYLNKEFDGSQDYDLIFRATENANRIIHIPKILYHWRMNEDSVALNSSAKPYAYEAAKRAIKAHLERIGEDAEVEDSECLGIYNLNYKIKGSPKVSIIIPNKDNKKFLSKCIKSIFAKTNYGNIEIIIVENNSNTKGIRYYKKIQSDCSIKVIEHNQKQFNYSELNNYGISKCSGEYVVLLNNDIKIISNNWIEKMLGICQRKDVGIVGTKLLYKNRNIQHAGIVFGNKYVAWHVNAGSNLNDSGYMARNNIIQNYSAVTGAMMMISKKDYNSVGGMDEEFPIAYNDVDLCFKIREKHKVVVMNPLILAYHYESRTRDYDDKSEEKKNRLREEGIRFMDKWNRFYEKTDPYFNPNFRQDIAKMVVRKDRVNI